MLKGIKNIFTNKATDSRVMIQCKSLVNKEAVTRQIIDGVEHIVVSSITLPDDIVMNGALYPASEIKSSFHTLEGTLAPIEHPVNSDGEFISAIDPRAIHDFHAGAFNNNVRQEDGRVHIDKFINVREAIKTDRGKRLLDRIEELETSSDPRPIHTSVAAFATMTKLPKPKTNAAGDEFEFVASDLVFDHDAILLDSVGAAQPHQGVGVAVNSEGKQFTVNAVNLEVSEDQSFSDIHTSVMDAFERSAVEADFIVEMFSDRVIFQSRDQLFEVPFVTDESGISTIVGIPLPVEREVNFIPVTNSEGDPMKKLIVNALKEAGIETESMSDDELVSAFQNLNVNEETDPEPEPAGDDLASIVANAVQPLADQVKALQGQINASDDAELDRLAGLVANSDQFPGVDADSAKLMGVDKLQELTANMRTAFGLSPMMQTASDDTFSAPAEMPK